MILDNLQKVFEIIDCKILIKEMKYLGFSKNVNEWFKSYDCEGNLK